MIEFSLYILLIIYAIALIGIFVIAGFNLYHLFSYGFLSFSSFFVTFLFLAGVVLILFITYQYGAQIDWSQTIVI